jgi:outer membrane protein assembly factor BamB
MGVAMAASGADWPQFRGPNRDGISRETGWFKEGVAVRAVWSNEVGAGYSGVAVKGGRLYTMGHAQGKDAVRCLDAATGKPLWSYEYPCGGGSYPGPRCTPTVEGGKVFTLSREGLLLCLEAEKGAVVWQSDLAKEIGVEGPKWGLASSPLIVDDLVLVNVGTRGLAADKATGAVRWNSGGSGASYASPVLFKQSGVPAVLIFNARSLAAAELATGKELWTHAWRTDWDVNAPDPIVTGDQVLITTGYGRGAALLSVAGDKPKVIWENQDLSSQFSSLVLVDGCLYGISGNVGGGEARCLDPATGAIKWSGANTGFGSLMVADGKLIILNEKGSLIVASAAPDAYKELWNQKVLNGVCWTVPSLCNGLIYCRNDKGRLVCLDLSGK